MVDHGCGWCSGRNVCAPVWEGFLQRAAHRIGNRGSGLRDPRGPLLDGWSCGRAGGHYASRSSLSACRDTADPLDLQRISKHTPVRRCRFNRSHRRRGLQPVPLRGLFNSGYRRESFSTPFLHGAEGLLLGRNKSLLLFAPIVVLLIPCGFRLWRNNRLLVSLAASNFVIFFVLAALWHSWQGGWSWGPRLILPGVIAALPLLASATQYEKGVGVGLLLLGFAISASTLIVPTQAQQLDHPPPTNGPAVIRQYELVPSVVRYSAHHLRAAHVPGISRKYVSLWQVNVGRQLGTKGLLFGLIGSLVLLAALAAVPARLMAC